MTDTSTRSVHLTARSAENSLELFFAAWAILFRAYNGSEFVDFCSVCIENIRKNSNEPYQEKLTLTKPYILRYEIRDDAFVHRLRPIRSRLSNDDIQELGIENKFGSINTGSRKVDIDLSISARSYSDTVVFVRSLIGAGSVIDLFVCVNKTDGALDVVTWCDSPNQRKSFIAHVMSNMAHIWHIVQDPNRKVNEISTVSRESLDLLQKWNPENLFYRKSCMHHLVEAISRACPDQIAVCAWDGNLTHQQLDVCASQVARMLVDLGISRGDFVPFTFEKSMWTVVATLGILKAGAAFVPMEPSHPRSRLQEIVTMTKAKAIVSSSMWESLCSDLVKHVLIVSGDTVDSSLNLGTSQLVSIPSSTRDPILVFFTSGSTGRPKGMVHEHAAICTHAIAHGEIMGYQGSRILQFSAHTFDVAVIDMFTTLLFGGCICIPSEDERRTDITGAISRLQADHLFLTPTFASLLEPLEVPSVRTLVVGGETLSQDFVDHWAKAVNLIQVYGPAEVGICLLTRLKAGKTKARNVGYPLPNCSCWLVDPNNHDRLVPIGAVGEMVVASSSLARGYLDDKARTAEVFLDPPTWAKGLGLPYEKFYRTGDLLVHNLADLDGSYLFVGRKDHQIKLRGQRLEPAEVEERIVAFHHIATAIVVCVDAGILAGELTAVVQLRGERDAHLGPDSMEIIETSKDTFYDVQSSLKHDLPAFMVPSRFLAISNMPRVPALKIDRPSVKRWLRNLKTLPHEVAVPFYAELHCMADLEPGETTAIEISTKIVSMLSIPTSQISILSGKNLAIHCLGLNSARIISLSFYLRRRFQSVIRMELLWDPAITVRQLASAVGNTTCIDECINQQNRVRSLVNTYQSCLMDTLSGITHEQPIFAVTKQRHILLTGATGYLGSGILKQILVSSLDVVYLLVRGTTPTDSARRLNNIMARSKWWHDRMESRLHIWHGDMSLNNLGLDHDQFQGLRGEPCATVPKIDTIIHNAAHVSYNATFAALVQANVMSTATLLKVAASSTSIRDILFVTGGRAPEVDVPTFDDSCKTLDEAGGYPQTKFVAEQLMRCAAYHPLFSDKCLSVLRPGYIIGAASDGKANVNDFIWRFIACCIEIGAYSEDDAEQWLFIAGVDQVADQVVRLVRGETEGSDGTSESTFRHKQVLTGLRFRDLWKLLLEEFGYAIIGKPADVWVEDMRKRVLEVGEDHHMYPLLHTLQREGRSLGRTCGPDTTHEIDREIICHNVRYLIHVGLFPRPSASWVSST